MDAPDLSITASLRLGGWWIGEFEDFMESGLGKKSADLAEWTA
jgi:hypothetical protein